MSTDNNKFDAWAIVELFGHQVIAGRVTDQALGGETFIRVDVPQTQEKPAYTRLFGKGAIYSITPTTEDVVCAYLQRNRQEPILPYMLAAPATVKSPNWEELENQARMREDALDEESMENEFLDF